VYTNIIIKLIYIKLHVQHLNNLFENKNAAVALLIILDGSTNNYNDHTENYDILLSTNKNKLAN